MSEGSKHYVQCRCFLPNTRSDDSARSHAFVVFSQIDDNEEFQQTYVECDNCGIVHKVVDYCESEIMDVESFPSIVRVADVKPSVPLQFSEVLERYRVGLATWQQVLWILTEERWGSRVDLESKYVDNVKHGKAMRITSSSTFVIESYSSNMVAE